MENLQSLFAKNNNMEFDLEQDQYKGPLIIDRPCLINGHGSTIWAKKGPAIIINSKNVVIRDLNVELTKRNVVNIEKTAIQMNYGDTKFANVKIVGEIKGLGNDFDWKLPIKFDLKEYDPNEFRTYMFPIRLPIKAKLVSNCPEIIVSPTNLDVGANNIKIQVKDYRYDHLLYGEIYIVTGGISRKIAIVGHSVPKA